MSDVPQCLHARLRDGRCETCGVDGETALREREAFYADRHLFEIDDTCSRCGLTMEEACCSPRACRPHVCDCGAAKARTTHSDWCSIAEVRR